MIPENQDLSVAFASVDLVSDFVSVFGSDLVSDFASPDDDADEDAEEFEDPPPSPLDFALLASVDDFLA